MGRKKSKKIHEEKELWSRKFDDEEKYPNGNYSRTERKKAAKNVSPVMKSLVIFLALFIILPTSVYIWYSNNANKTDQALEPDDSVVITQNESSREKSESVSSIKKAEESDQDSNEIQSESTLESKKTEESKESKESKESRESKEVKVAEETENKLENKTEIEKETKKETKKKETEVPSKKTEERQKTETTEEVGQSRATYTVKSGDNLYRIALNHNMTTEELKAMNGLSNDNVTVGTVLNIK